MSKKIPQPNIELPAWKTKLSEWDSSEECNILVNQFVDLLIATKRPGIENLIPWLEEKNNWGMNFYNTPASTRFHGSEYGGLVKHSLLVYEELCFLQIQYESKGKRCTLKDENRIITALLHDICKCRSYIPQVLKSGGEAATPFKTQDDFPLGHGEKSVALILRFIDLTPLEQLMIRWHMGPFDYAYKGVQSWLLKYPEVKLLYLADDLASTMEGLEE